MIFKSPVFSQASGSIAGITYSHNAGGMYVRARPIPTNPNTENQQAVRSAMSQLVVAWRDAVGIGGREQWNTYAFNTPTLNKLGEPTSKTGQQMYIRSNVSRLQAGLPRVDIAPTEFDLGDFIPPTSIGVDDSSNQISIAFDTGDTWVHEDDSAMLIYMSRPQNVTRTFGKGPYQLLTAILGDATTPPTSPVTATPLFPVAEGQRVFFLVRVSRADGRLSSTYTTSSVVVA